MSRFLGIYEHVSSPSYRSRIRLESYNLLIKLDFCMVGFGVLPNFQSLNRMLSPTITGMKSKSWRSSMRLIPVSWTRQSLRS